ncbi:MAG: DNA-3-methyladenine glycosylase I [bacterium]
MKKELTRCDWTQDDELMMKYHDEEWGVPLHDDQKLFEYIVLDAFQAGLSWKTILHKRENFRRALDNFNPKKIAKYSEKKIEKLMNDAGIIRNKLKIQATITNAKAFLEIQKQFGTFDKYIWQFTNFKTIKHKRKTIHDLPATSKESDEMSKDLKKRGFKFVGSTICYAFMQAAGMVNDHTVTCFRYNTVNNEK